MLTENTGREMNNKLPQQERQNDLNFRTPCRFLTKIGSRLSFQQEAIACLRRCATEEIWLPLPVLTVQ